MIKIKYHLYGILIFTCYLICIDLILDKGVSPKLFFLVLIREIWIFYTIFFVLYFTLLSIPRKFLFAVLILLISIIVSYFFTLYYAYVKQPSNSINYFDRKHFVSLLTFYTQFSLYALGYFFFERTLVNQKKISIKEKNVLESQNKILLLMEVKVDLESKLRQSELNFLRAQINPHFLQNCLNFIYSDTRKTNASAADAILLLSNIMRYSVADNAEYGGKALLQKEIEQIENVIQIHQLRFQQKLSINFSYTGNLQGKTVVPMILLTLVENLIKYGDLNNATLPAKIECYLNEKESQIVFITSNKKSFLEPISSTGLGLKNISERLALTCGDNFTLEKEEIDDWYNIKLIMPYFDIDNNKL